MLQRLMNRKVVIGLLGILILLAAFGRIMTTPAEEYRFVTWEKGTSENEVKVSVMLSAREEVQKAGTFQVQFGVASDDPDGIEDIKFKFDSDLKNNSDVTVKTYRYNQSNGTLTIYVSGAADDILKKGTALNLGTIVVNADSDVTFSVEPGGCKTADENYTERTLTVFGSQDDYTVKRETSDDDTPNETPEETTPDETPEETPGETGPAETPEETLPDETPGGTLPEETTDSSEPEETPEQEDSSDSVWKDPEETSGTWKAKDGVWSFEKEDGTYAQSEWIKVGGEWYWIGADGRMITGWIHLNNVWYFCSPSGAMKTGWVNTGDHWFYFSPSGAMKTGWVLEKGCWYYMSESGAMKTGWVQTDGKWYYLDESGKMLADTVTPDGVRVDKNGVRVNGITE
ncbi:hypothetical protein AAAV70_17005 [Hungatella hathewayi]|uniref:N-acetylmuramoyl-L-alanine amidase family protein n=1 Tax=Hungatella hathewayi TaxID=154046 RepID=UPI0032C1953C